MLKGWQKNFILCSILKEYVLFCNISQIWWYWKCHCWLGIWYHFDPKKVGYEMSKKWNEQLWLRSVSYFSSLNYLILFTSFKLLVLVLKMAGDWIRRIYPEFMPLFRPLAALQLWFWPERDNSEWASGERDSSSLPPSQPLASLRGCKDKLQAGSVN